MIDEIWKREEVESPCIKLCVLHSTAKICIGCYRSADEIQKWSRYSSKERHLIIEELPSRGKIFTKRRGGRSRRLKDQSNL